MKKIASLLLAVFILSFHTLAVSAKEESWYFSSKGKNERPGLPNLETESAKGIGPDDKVVYLTFDAGYENGNVKKCVDILKEHQVTGAFFVLSHFISANPQLCREISENGNLVCNHTATHPTIPSLSEEKLKEELDKVAALYRETVGAEMAPYFRPPKGVYDTSSLERIEKLGYRTVFWSLAWEDWDNNNQKPPEYAMEKLMSRVHNGAVILLHSTSETNAKILGDFIAALKNEGYRFGSLEELWEA